MLVGFLLALSASLRVVTCSKSDGMPTPRSIGVAYPFIDIHPGTEFEAFEFAGAPGYLSHFWLTLGMKYDNETLVRYYVDGESSPSIAVRPLEAIGVFFAGTMSNKTDAIHSGGEPWQNSLFGKTGEDGGIWWNWKVPFQNSVRVTIERRTRAPAKDPRYIIIRGVRDATQFAVGDAILTMAQQPRLKLQRTNVTLQPYEFAQILSSTESGMLLLVHKRVISSNKRFTEGCIRVFEGNLTRAPSDYDWLLSTGVEDYFDSGSHWSHMLPGGRYPIYHGEDAGLTHFNHNLDPLKDGEAPCSGDSPPGLGAYGDCHLSAYKLHHHDHVMFSKASGGMKLEWRNGEPGSRDAHKCGHVDEPFPHCSPIEPYNCGAVVHLITDVFYYEFGA
eukprot:COSAG02_NODE_5573_length_4221_cov_5.669335_3_plen_388_part_00